MKLLHTSDWHLGRSLFGKKRYNEFSAFLSWLAHTIETENIDVLLVAGDIFDTSTPSNRAQSLYYQFLKEVSDSDCRHIIIIGGNHDSPSLLEAPRDLLRFFQVHVIGSGASNPEDEVITLKDAAGHDELIVCAVPYLRDRDIRLSGTNETLEEKSSNLVCGIANHYKTVCEVARRQQAASPQSPPIVATGHLFAAGGRRVEGDGVRDLYIGSLAHVHASIFPDNIDYLALGHLHTPQLVGDSATRRYSGSPLPMSFAEAGKEKCVLTVTFADHSPTVKSLSVPCFQQMRNLRGTLPEILQALSDLKESNSSAWLEIIFDGDEIIADLQGELREAVIDSNLEILRIVNNRIVQLVLQQTETDRTLETMSEEQVFRRCLEVYETPTAQQPELLQLFRRTLQAVREEDTNAE